jgi:hypothetical protein
MTTPPAAEHRRTVKLPLGFRCTFAFAVDTGLRFVWHPGIPRIESNRARRRFMAAYTAERDRFLAEVAGMLGAAVVVAGGNGGATTIMPEARQ